MRWWLLLLLGSSACNRVFGITDTDLREILDAPAAPDADPRADLDQDGIKDIEDPCIAPEVDLLIDSDYDQVPNSADLCPFDPTATVDTDGDGAGDICDPSNATQDRRRCVMAFADPDFNVAMWRVRDNPLAWHLYYPRVLYGVSQGSIVADWAFEAPTITTIEITGNVFNNTTRFSVYPRAAREPGVEEVGCELVAGASWSLASTGRPLATLGTFPPMTATRYWIQMTVSPAAADGVTLRCRARLGSNAIATVESTEPLPQGTLGFASSRGSVTGLVIYERPDAL